MAKRFCKLDRRDIAASLGEIQSLVAAPKYLCRSCARASADKSALCKPMALPVSDASPAISADERELIMPVAVCNDGVAQPVSKKALKQAKKSAKKQAKFHKKMKKVLKKQQKLLKKHHKLERQFSRVNQRLTTLNPADSSAARMH
ncbi:MULTISPECIES: hypothetical protein [unclassified Vibrio]|uniref:hypothetical protein n=1 Tax=unclassified Vibrio TaxID=2614977 RepID=UPI0013617AD7|nr:MULTISPECIES: hypothetical protein [unclassified Vibrio]NAW56697.1 hypothetical protein [Vibrio sp. V36_P2S2PM302]NAX20759.1 hypothetical protein [Vibrio sp. V39_P1S14PM300]NAX25645.1 hypothetical protein [Vibrio sp. V38_P2S17PM301]NAX30396.1 hypothetical protein [Vibrio sp. V37_P2S8PM304]